MAPVDSREQLRLFVTLSERLTGETGLDQERAQSHLGRLQHAFPNLIEQLLERWQATAQDPETADRAAGAMLSDAVLGAAAKAVILIWYTGGLKMTVGGATIWEIESAADYF